ncbi:hypothetical protein CANARDRAFT_26849 [[Candida] arabinofermentans NRRL YB-2248]|uniref:UDENN domain-containing protein n=1 Tax=[Candida] arabinofermentans NRRL YB-2248 TaxID=983967 RepID=A0A1E4T6T1_9ASCO|nr:hypothetical protein CANARDRAFT_26849 [[Candida] arabinofermentans NRRL YB-2248]
MTAEQQSHEQDTVEASSIHSEQQEDAEVNLEIQLEDSDDSDLDDDEIEVTDENAKLSSKTDDVQVDDVAFEQHEDVPATVYSTGNAEISTESKKTESTEEPEAVDSTSAEASKLVEQKASEDVDSITAEQDESSKTNEQDSTEDIDSTSTKQNESSQSIEQEVSKAVNDTSLKEDDAFKSIEQDSPAVLEVALEDSDDESTDPSTSPPTLPTQTAPTPDTQPVELNSTPIQPTAEKDRTSIPTENKNTSTPQGFIFGVCIVDFHHIRGPEIEYWIDDNTTDTNQEEQISKFSKLWPQLPFQGLPDGAHLFDETFTNFTLLYDEVNGSVPTLEDQDNESYQNDNVTTLFGCACIRQLNSDQLKNVKNPDDIKRSIIQKSIVLITRYPITIQLKEKLSIITTSYFSQYDFTDKSILKALYENISIVYNRSGYRVEDDDLYELPNLTTSSLKIIKESDFYTGLNLKELVQMFKRNLMVLFKALLLEQRIVIFSKDLNKLSTIQYSLLSLIPNLILNLSDSGSPSLCKLSNDLTKPTSLKSSDRNSMLKFIGLPLQIFNKGGFFQPYLTLQQLDQLNSEKTKWYLIGCSNDIIMDQKQKIADIVISLGQGGESIDSSTIKLEILNPLLKDKLSLTAQDKKFMDNLISEVSKNDQLSNINDNDDNEVNSNELPFISKTLNNNTSMDSKIYKGGDDFIRYQFEEYLIGMLSSIKYDNFLNNSNLEQNNYMNLSTYESTLDYFNLKFIEFFKSTLAYKIFEKSTDDELFNFFEPKHVYGNLLTGSIFFKNLFHKWTPANQQNAGNRRASPNLKVSDELNSLSEPELESESESKGKTNNGEEDTITDDSNLAKKNPPVIVSNALNSMSNFWTNLKKPKETTKTELQEVVDQAIGVDDTEKQTTGDVTEEHVHEELSTIDVNEADDQEPITSDVTTPDLEESNNKTIKPKFSNFMGWVKRS